MAQHTVAIYGPQPKQYQRVLAQLPSTFQRTCRFRLNGRNDFRVRAATVHVVWGRFVSHQLVERARTAGGQVIRVQHWNAAVVGDVLRTALRL